MHRLQPSALAPAARWPCELGKIQPPNCSELKPLTIRLNMVWLCLTGFGYLLHDNLGHMPVVLTYLTDVPERAWPLGLSASLHGLPLVIVGRGMRWELEERHCLPA